METVLSRRRYPVAREEGAWLIPRRPIRISSGSSSSGESRDVHLEAGEVRWLGDQTHSGENIGDTPTHVVFVELKEARPDPPARRT
jgi:hypothetical protein